MSDCTDTAMIELRIASLRAIIQGLYDLQVQALTTGKGGVTHYEYNDGQTSIKTDYQSSADIAKAIDMYESQLYGLERQVCSRDTYLRPSHRQHGF